MKNFIKRFSYFFIPGLLTFFILGCTGINISTDGDNSVISTQVETASIVLTINNSQSRAIFSKHIDSAVITVKGSDFSDSISTEVSVEDGKNAEDIVISGVPVGKNRIITVKAKYDENELKNVTMRAVSDIVSGTNEINISWSTTALGNVYKELMDLGVDISSLSDTQDEKIAAATDCTAGNAHLVDAEAIASDFKSDTTGSSLGSSDSYLLTPGSISFTFYYPIDEYDEDSDTTSAANTFCAWFCDPLSEVVTDCNLGEKITISNCTPGTYTLYLTDKSGTRIHDFMNVKVSEGTENPLGVLSYSGIMVVVDAEKYAAYNTLYAWNCSVASYASSDYPGDEMTQYGSYYIKAFPGCSTTSVIANNGSSGDSNKLRQDDNVFTSYGIYELTSDGYTTLAGGSTTSASEDEDEADVDYSQIDYSNCLYVNLSTPSWSTTEGGDYTTITTTKATIGTSDNCIKIQLKKNDGVSTGLVQINAENTSGATEIHLTGTMTTGGVKVQTNGTDAVIVYLNGTTIASSNYPCLEITKGATAYVVLEGTNTFTDGRSYGTGYGEEYSTSSGATYTDDGETYSCTVVKAATYGSDAKGTLYCKGNLILDGSGSLTLTESYKNCIASKGFITVNGGNYNLTSNAKNGFSALYGFTQNDGDISFTGNGGILLYKLSNSSSMGGGSSSSYSTASSAESAYVHKTTGIVVDGIISDTDNGWIKINGGSYTCNAKYGKGMNAKWDSSEDTDTDGGSGTPDPSLYIKGGTITVTVSGNEYNGDNNIKGTYYDADGVLCESAEVTCAAEGLESEVGITVSGGVITINSEDDAFNASSSSGKVVINGGSIYACATSGDGIDCNGSVLTITDGIIIAMAPTGSENALDCDGTFTIAGGYLAALAGSSTVEGSWTITQPVIHVKSGSSGSSFGGNMGGQGGSSSSTSGAYSASTSVSAGTTVVVKDGSSNVLYAFTVPSGVSASLMTLTSPNFSGVTMTSCSLYTGCSVSGGTNWNGLYTSMPTASSGSSYSISNYSSSSSFR